MALIEPLGKVELDELIAEIDRRLESADARLKMLWVQQRGHMRQAARHRSGARTTGTMTTVENAPSAPHHDVRTVEAEQARLQMQQELANATMAASQSATHAQRAVDHLGNVFTLERQARKSSTSLLAVPVDRDDSDKRG